MIKRYFIVVLLLSLFPAIAVVATPAAAVIAAVVSSASAPVFLGLGFIDNQGSSLKFLAVHGFNCGAH